MTSSLARISLTIMLAFIGAQSPPTAFARAAPLPQPRVAGVVLDQAGAPVASAQVRLLAPQTSLVQTTAADGRFAFAVAATEGARLVVSASGFARFERALGATGEDWSQLEVRLAPALLTEQVTVTATRTETLVGETAASVRVLSAREIETSAAATLDDTLRQVPGFQLFRRTGSRAANPTAQGVSLRGVGASGASRALVLADGLPLNDPFGGWIYWGRIPRASISRVEVLRGGASSLYGSAALGGVVNILSRRIEERPALSLEASYGQQRTADASLFTSGRIGDWGASLAAEAFRTDGYILVAERERGRVDTPAASGRAALNLTLDRRLTENLNLFARGSYYAESRDNGTPLQTNSTRLRQLSAGADWHGPRAGTFAARAYTGAQIFHQSFSAIAADRASETLTRTQRVPAQTGGALLQWSRSFGARHALVAGAEARETRGASDEVIYVVGRPASLVGAGGRERAFGLFIEDTVRVASRLILTGGARFDRWRNYAALEATRPLAPAGAATTVTLFPARVETAFSPRASALVRATESLSFSASAYRAFRAPTLNELYRAFRVGNVLTLANADLRAERLTGGEAGASYAPAHRRLSARGAVYWMETTRSIANVTLNVAPNLITRQRRNLGRTRSRGFEVEAEAHLTERWTLTSGYLFTDARVVSFPANLALEGLRIPQVPRSTYTFQARYADRSRWTFAAQGRASGAQFDDDQNQFRLAGYFALDAYLARRLNRQAELFVAAENLFNQRAEVGRTPVLTLGPPRTARFGLRLRFAGR